MESKHGRGGKESLTRIPPLDPPFAPDEFGNFNQFAFKKHPDRIKVKKTEKIYFKKYLAKYGKLLDLNLLDAAHRHGLAPTTMNQWPSLEKSGELSSKCGEKRRRSGDTESDTDSEPDPAPRRREREL